MNNFPVFKVKNYLQIYIYCCETVVLSDLLFILNVIGVE